MTFCDDPDLVATTPEYAWGAGVFFWMENLKEETTCHIEALAHHDFGGTLNNINGMFYCVFNILFSICRPICMFFVFFPCVCI